MKIQYLFFTALLFVACSEQNEVNNSTNPPSISTEMQPSLKSILDEKKALFEQKADEKTKTIYAEGINSVRESGLIESAKQVGDTAPNFKLKNAIGNTVELSSYLKSGPVVLTWYRGGWCPYCNLTLQRMQQELPKIKSLNANLIALTPEIPDSSITTAEKHNLEFEILSDIGNQIAREYGVVFELTPEVAEIYNKKFGLVGYNGDNSNTLPLAATYIIDQNGIIVYSFLDADYRNRAEPSEIIEELKKLR